MEKCRVNRITVNIDKKNDETTISLYKTNTLLGIINVDDLGIDSFQNSGVSAKAYQAYCKDIIINLLDNDGINGYYYDPKEERAGVKYGVSEFYTACAEYVSGIIGDHYEWKRTHVDNMISVDQYGDGFIKNAKGILEIMITEHDVKLQIVGEIKSGQMCRPRVLIYKEDEYAFNITNINKIVKSL